MTYFMSASLVGSFKPQGKKKEKKKVIRWSSGCFALLEAEREKCYEGVTETLFCLYFFSSEVER